MKLILLKVIDAACIAGILVNALVLLINPQTEAAFALGCFAVLPMMARFAFAQTGCPECMDVPWSQCPNCFEERQE